MFLRSPISRLSISSAGIVRATGGDALLDRADGDGLPQTPVGAHVGAYAGQHLSLDAEQHEQDERLEHH